MKTLGILILILTVALIIGCDENNDHVLNNNSRDLTPPPVPQGVLSVTRSNAVLLYWWHIDDVSGDFANYVVYRSVTGPYDGYLEIGRTVYDSFVDNNVVNGSTYYYAVSSRDLNGNLSDLSYEDVYDTPRPQGTSRMLVDFNVEPTLAGWNFGASQVVRFDSPYCDFYLEYFDGDGVFYFNVGNINTDVQDMGFTDDLDEIDVAPLYGWSLNGWCEVIAGHTYVFWTEDNRYAKIRVTAINSDNVVFDWAYQTDAGNPELKPKVTRPAGYLRHDPNVASAAQ